MKKKYPKSDLYIMGRSLGGLSAVHIAAARESAFKGLILESTFSDAVPVLEHIRIQMGSKKEEIRNYFLIKEQLKGLKLSILILHGTSDSLIPFSHGQDNYKSLISSGRNQKDVVFVPLEGAEHNNTMHHPDYFIKLMEFVK
jgi:pimeloyl-ACP methyl ester carboxylesterase